MARQDLFHNFFWGGRDSYSGSNVSFTDNRFYSYATVIGIKLTDDEGEEWLMTSYWNMSSTTCKHLYALRAACPHDNIMSVPMYYGKVVYDASDIAYNFRHWAENINENSFKKRDNRLEFISLHNNWILFRQRFRSVLDKHEWFLRVNSLLDDYRKIADGMEEHLEELHRAQESRTPEEIEAMREKRRLAEERRQKRIEEKTAAVMAMPYLLRVQLIFNRRSVHERPADIPKEAWTLAAQEMMRSGEKRGYSFMWPVAGGVRTSQGVYVTKDEVEKAIFLYLRTKKVLGSEIGGFKLVRIDEKAVQVGCHLIPMENVKAVAEAYGIEWK